jgi:hypothetical protein
MTSGHRIAHLVFYVFLTLALASCGTWQDQDFRAPRPIATAKPIKTILLVSTVSNKLATRHDESVHALRPKAEPVLWDFHGHSLRVLQTYLSQAYRVSTADIPAESLGMIDFTSGFEDLQQRLNGKIEAGKHDLILVIAPISPSGTNASLLFAPGQTYQVAFTYILVALDGNDFGVTGVGYAPNDYFARIRRLRWHGRTFVDMNEVDKRIVERTVNRLIDRNIPRSLETLGLKGNSPPL